MDVKEYKISNHAMERFAERMMDKDNVTDIRTFINNHKQDICTRINKLIGYGELIYSPRVENEVKQYFYKDKRIVVVAPKSNTVITLYKIDLGDDEVTDLFVKKILDKLKIEQAVLDDVKEQVSMAVSEYKKAIEDNENEIKYCKNVIKHFEETNDGLNKLIKNSNVSVLQQTKVVEDLVETLIKGRKF